MYGLEQAGILVKFPLGINELRAAYPTTSFTNKVPLSEYKDFGVVDVYTGACPAYDRDSQKVSLNKPYKSNDGRWFRNWTIESLSDQELAAMEEVVAANVRAQRNMLLKETDWTQLTDAQPSVYSVDGFTEYRQALRAIPEQEGFPHNVIWPEKPVESA